tara:strand:- start:48487 stop:50472 length:1986 start_codon:yes stop_codon:yes gene_type:complete
LLIKQYICPIFIVFLIPPSYAGSGIVLLSKQTPVEFSTIINKRTKTWSTSDEAGFFLIPDETIIGDSLYIERIGCNPATVLYDGKLLKVKLTPDPILFPQITIHNNSDFITKILPMGSSRNEILNRIPGSALRNYGGSAGIAQATVDGGRTVDIKVLFNNIDLTNSQNGLTDLSQLPMQYLGFGNLDQNNHLQFGSGSTDGAIKLTPSYFPTGFQIYQGSDGYSNIFAHIGFGRDNKNFKIAAGRNTDPGTHPVIYGKKNISRQNQRFNQKFSGIDLKFKSDKWLSNLSACISLNERGINGLIWSPNPEAYRKDTLSLFSGSAVRLFPKGFFQTTLSYRSSGENYVDPSMSINSIHIFQTVSSNLTGRFSPNKIMDFRFYTGLSSHQLNSTDAGLQKRISSYFSASIVLKNLDLDLISAAFRLDDYSDFGSGFTLSGKLKKQLYPYLSISAKINTSFRAPAFNDLYWKPGGNQYLQPEKATTTRISAFLIANKFSFDVNIKKTESNNLIIWIPVDNSWAAENLDKTRRYIFGVDANFNLSDQIYISGSLKNIISKNLRTGNELRYTPSWIGSIQCQIKKSEWITDLSFNYLGSQIVIYDYPKNLMLSPAIDSHLCIQIPPLFDQKIRLKMYISNLLNREIMTIYGYPEHSRATRIEIFYKM